MSPIENYSDEGNHGNLKYKVVLVIALIAVVILVCGLFIIRSVWSNGDYTAVTDNFYISDMEKHGALFNTYYTANITNGYCDGVVYLSEGEAKQLEDEDLVKMLVITNSVTNTSVATTNINLNENFYGEYFRSKQRFSFVYGSANDSMLVHIA